MIVHVRWPAKNSGAFVFGCPFLCFFLLGKQKKEKKWRYILNFSYKHKPIQASYLPAALLIRYS